MPRDRDSDASGGQSKRPALSRQQTSESTSDSTVLSSQQRHKAHHQHHVHQHNHKHRLHARSSSTKNVHKYQPNAAAAANSKSHQSARRQNNDSPPPEFELPQDRLPSRSNHRRVLSEVNLPHGAGRTSPSAKLPKSASQTSLKRNRSHVEIAKRTRSSDKLKRTSSGTGINRLKPLKSQVHFDLGNGDDEDEDEDEDGDDAGEDGNEDEWVDASGSNSPYLSRKGSFNSSGQSSARPGNSAQNSRQNSRPQTPNRLPSHPVMSTPDRERNQHKEYLTSRLLQRTPSHGAPPKMTADTVQVTPQISPNSAGNTSTLPSSSKDGVTSRFVEAVGSGLTSQGSFYHKPRSTPRRSDEGPRRPRSMASLSNNLDAEDGAVVVDEDDNSALVPRPAKRTVPPAETSRTQQKLNLQRARSEIEPGQAVTSVGGVVGANPLIGVRAPGYDGGQSRDPRVGKLLEKTGMEYLVVRRYQNPIARSLHRLGHLPNMDKTQRIPRPNTAYANGKRSLDPAARHSRNVSMPEPRAPGTPRKAGSVRTVGGGNTAGSSFEESAGGTLRSLPGGPNAADDARYTAERLSGSSLVGGEEEDGTAALLRNLWDKSAELSASN